jgi:hypothetical protein
LFLHVPHGRLALTFGNKERVLGVGCAVKFAVGAIKNIVFTYSLEPYKQVFMHIHNNFIRSHIGSADFVYLCTSVFLHAEHASLCYQM